MLLEMGFFKDIFKRNKLPSQDKLAALDERQILYNHCVAMTLLEFGKVEGKKLSPVQSQTLAIKKKETSRMKEILRILAEIGK